MRNVAPRGPEGQVDSVRGPRGVPSPGPRLGVPAPPRTEWDGLPWRERISLKDWVGFLETISENWIYWHITNDFTEFYTELQNRLYYQFRTCESVNVFSSVLKFGWGDWIYLRSVNLEFCLWVKAVKAKHQFSPSATFKLSSGITLSSEIHLFLFSLMCSKFLTKIMKPEINRLAKNEIYTRYGYDFFPVIITLKWRSSWCL